MPATLAFRLTSLLACLRELRQFPEAYDACRILDDEVNTSLHQHEQAYRWEIAKASQARRVSDAKS